MIRKKIAALLVALAMIAAMPTTAFAAIGNDPNENDQTTPITEPGHKAPISGERDGYDADDPTTPNPQTDGASYGFAVADSNNGTEWKVKDDDDEVDETGSYLDTHKTDINVWARISDASAKIYKIDIAWGSMKFEFNDGSGSWNVLTHTYDGTTGGTPHWVNNYDNTSEETTYEVGANGTNNKVTVTNHSNSAINAAFVYAMSGTTRQGAGGTAATMFNDGGTDTSGTYGNDYGDGVDGSYNLHADHDVIGYFYGNNDDAAKAHKAIAYTYNSGVATNIASWKYDATGSYQALGDAPVGFLSVNAKANEATGAAELANTIVLPTADWSHKPAQGVTSGINQDWDFDASDLKIELNDFQQGGSASTPTYENGARSANVYFAFSGQPDKGQGTILSTFTKVGVITVTITPNDSAEYNKIIS